MHKCLDPQKASKKVGLMLAANLRSIPIHLEAAPEQAAVWQLQQPQFLFVAEKTKILNPSTPQLGLPNWACSRLLNSFSQPLRAGTSKKQGLRSQRAWATGFVKSPSFHSCPGAVDLSQQLLHQLLVRILQMIRMRLALVVQIIQIHGWIVLTRMDL